MPYTTKLTQRQIEQLTEILAGTMLSRSETKPKASHRLGRYATQNDLAVVDLLASSFDDAAAFIRHRLANPARRMPVKKRRPLKIVADNPPAAHVETAAAPALANIGRPRAHRRREAPRQDHRPVALAHRVGRRGERCAVGSRGAELGVDDLLDFDPDREQWCRSVLAELSDTDKFDVDMPQTYRQLCSDAEEDKKPVAKFVIDYKGGLTGYLGELMLWCREQISKAEGRPQIQALAEQVRSMRLILSDDTLEVIARYQTTLDNQLYKGL